MIVRPHPNAWHVLCSMHGSIVPAILPQIIIAALLGVGAVLLQRGFMGSDAAEYVQYEFAPFAAMGVAISIFMGFRNKASYDRWWEARQQWGKQLIVVRALARLVLTIGPEAPEARHIITLAMAHTHALRVQLRGDPPEDRDRFLADGERAAVGQLRNPADGILRLAGRALGEWHRSRGIDSYEMVAVSQQLDGLAEVQGAVERLASTPLPYPYTLLLLRTAWLYVLLAPFALAAPLNWYTPLFNAIVAYTFFGLNEVARHMEAPFRSEPQCLALSAMCRVIEISVCEALGEAAPEPLVAEKFQLM